MKSSRAKVAFIHQPWSVIEPPVRGPDSIALWTDEVAHRLIDHCDVICYSRRWKNQPSETSHSQIRYRRVSVSIDKWLRGGFTKLDELGWRNTKKPFYASKWCYRQFISQVVADLRRNPVDIVHIQNFSQFVPIVRDALPRVKIVLHMHAEWLAELDREMIGQRLQHADSIIFCSNFFAGQVQAAWPQYAHRCRAVYNGVTISEFQSARKSPNDSQVKRILFAGRVSPDKGVHVLVDAFNKIVQKHPQAQLKIVGPWSTLPKSFYLAMTDEKIVAELARFYGRPYVDQLREGISPEAARRVEIAGAINREDLIASFQSADVLTLPSIYLEGFGIPIAEAGACRVPSVVSRRGGMPEVVEDGKTGLIVEPGDPDALAAAILKLLDEPTLRQAMGEAAFNRVAENFTWERVAQSLIAEYDRLLTKPREQPESALSIAAA